LVAARLLQLAKCLAFLDIFRLIDEEDYKNPANNPAPPDEYIPSDRAVAILPIVFEGPALARPRFRFSETKSLHHRDAQSVTGLSENNAKNEAFITFTLLLAWFSVSSTLSSDIFAFV
jgi:hypothetical protein